ncbi:MFS transporter [Prescottella agglutinans]|uniref:MFS transporter n=1 Tax=Prescottella agglutinans TaxID=1644129 RepID=A0A3S3E783_9NOCA|nr:MFS transporter [Prescottella agglutinans]RVW06948.1 MFS transporter [Prescottella agglutinans]
MSGTLGTAATPPRAVSEGGWTPRLVLSLISIAVVLEIVSISSTMASVAMMPIGEHFKTDQIAWVTTAYLLAAAVACPLAGKLADIHGKRKVFLICMAIAAVGALVSAVAPNFLVLVLGRALFGVLIACMFLGFSLMRDVFPPKTLALAVSLAAGGMGLMTIPSPFITGVLVDAWGFRSIFWFLFVALVVMAPLVVLTTEETPVRNPARLDVVGAVLLGGGLAAILAGISFGPSWGWADVGTLLLIVGGLAVIAIWVPLALRTVDPIVDLRFFRRGPMLRICLSAGLAYGTISLYATLIPIMSMTPSVLGLGYGFGVDAKGVGLIQIPMGVGSVIGGIVVGRMLRTKFPTLTLAGGAAFMLAASVVTAFSHTGKPEVLFGILLFGLGMGATTASIPNLTIASVPPSVQASMSSMVQASQTLLASILPVIAFAVLNSNVATVIDGYGFYADNGMTIAYLIGGLSSLAAILVVMTLHRRRHAIAAQAATDAAASERDPEPLPAA